MFTLGSMDEREPLYGRFLENIKSKLCADKDILDRFCLKISFVKEYS